MIKETNINTGKPLYGEVINFGRGEWATNIISCNNMSDPDYRTEREAKKALRDLMKNARYSEEFGYHW